KLLTVCLTTIAENFSKLQGYNLDFSFLDDKQFHKLICNPDLNVQTENEVYLTVKNYVQQRKSMNKETNLYVILNQVRLDFLSPSMLEQALSDDLISKQQIYSCSMAMNSIREMPPIRKSYS